MVTELSRNRGLRPAALLPPGMELLGVMSRSTLAGRALSLAAEAVEWMERSDQLQWIADAYRGQAEVQLMADRLDDGRASLVRALELFEAKGDIPDSRRARRSLDDLTSA